MLKSKDELLLDALQEKIDQGLNEIGLLKEIVKLLQDLLQVLVEK